MPKYPPPPAAGAGVSNSTETGLRMLSSNATTMTTAAISSMNTPVELIRAISFTPTALITVVSTIRIAPSSTPLTAASPASEASPTSWKPDQICGNVSCAASATAASDTTEAVNIIQPASQDTVGPASCLDQL